MRALSRYSNALIAALVVAGVGLLTVGGVVQPAETLMPALNRALSDAEASGDGVAVVAIGGDGAQPWPRDRLARLHTRIQAGEPAVVAYALALETPQYRHPRQLLGGLLERHGDDFSAAARARLSSAVEALRTDRALAQSLAKGGTAIWGMRTSADAPASATAGDAGGFIRGAALPGAQSSPSGWARRLAPQPGEWVTGVHPPVAPVAEAATGLGLMPGSNRGSSGMLALARHHGDAWLPTLPLLAYAGARGVALDEISVASGQRLDVGGRILRTGPGLTVHVGTRAGARADPPPYPTARARAVLAGEVESAVFADRAVLVGLRAGADAAAAALGASELRPVGPSAWAVSRLIQGGYERVPQWALWTRIAAFVAVLVYLALCVPAVRSATGWVLTALLVIVGLNAELVMLLVQDAWMPLVAPAGALVLGHMGLSFKGAIARRFARLRSAFNASNRSLAESHREAGRLDAALECLRECDPDATTVERMYALALDFERRRRFPQAVEAFRYCARHWPGFRDAADRASRNEKLQNSISLGGRNHGRSTQTLAMDEDGVEKPVLGRYEIERELGRGAMGTVFLGRDPRIGRQVAIKTMPLDQEFEGQSLDEVKKRFLREAETAGRLSHPNIVTVHDVGEEQDLAYIAMDYLRGTPLVQFADPDTRLPVGEVFDVLAQVADALATAHADNVVHRDVKPDNIVYERDSGHVTVTDFGVACLLDERHTRTGTILGSPSYMSPEQLAGRGLDGRSDLFSLGVTLYQLLSGELPFTGDSLSSLMYRISHERHRELRRRRSDLPTCATTITNRCLEKDPDKRYASAQQMAQALRRCRAKWDQGGTGSIRSTRSR